LNRFIISLFVFIILLAVPPVILIYTGNGKILDPRFWAMFVFFILLTLMVCISVLIAQNRNSKTGVQVFMGGSTIKLLACMFFALFYVKFYPIRPISFISSFFYLYLFNTVFEIRTLLSNLRDQNKK